METKAIEFRSPCRLLAKGGGREEGRATKRAEKKRREKNVNALTSWREEKWPATSGAATYGDVVG